MGKIVFIGHSVVKGVGYGGVTPTDTFAYKIGIAAGYAAADVINKGVGSDTAAGMLARVQPDVIALAPDVCAVKIGANDWSSGRTVAAFKADVVAFLNIVQAAGIKVVWFTDNMTRGTSADFTSQYPFIEAGKEAAAAAGCVIVDSYGRMSQQVLVGDYAPLYAGGTDPIHYSVAGHSFEAAHALRSFYAGAFVKTPVSPPVPGRDLTPLVSEIAQVILDVGNPILTAGVKTELDKLQ